MMRMNNELAWKGFQLLLQREDYPGFFDALQESGFFAPATNPAPVPGERENSVRIPFWAPLLYLKAVAARAGVENDTPLAAKVMAVVRAVSTWRDDSAEVRRNYRTNQAFAEILGLVPTVSVVLGDIDLLGKWLNDPYDRTFVAAALDRGALPRFLSSPDPQDWEKAVRVLDHVTAITWPENSGQHEPTPAGVVDDFWLGELLRHHAKEIGRKAGENAVSVMLGRVRELFNTPIRRDHSGVFRPAVEDDPQNYQWRSIDNRVIEGLRDTLLGRVENDPDGARIVTELMLGDELQIIRRIGLYVLARHWAAMQDLYTGIVRSDLFSGGHSHELYRLLQSCFSEMNAQQKAATVSAIRNLPNPTYGDDPERLRRCNQYRWLSAINGKGYTPADEWFAELNADPGIGRLRDHPDFDSYITSWVGPGPTPYSPDELVALAKADDLVDKLNAFTPQGDWGAPTADGLTSVLEAAVRANPETFLDSLSQYLSAKPVYQDALIRGLQRAWEGNAGANWTRGWAQIVTFLEQVVYSQSFWQHADDMYQHWAVSAIADLLQSGTKNDEHAYDATLLPRTQLVIARLLECEPGADAPEEESMMQALNTSRGRVVEALYSQALRAARVGDLQSRTHREAWAAISPIFDTELAKCRNANYEFSTLSGTYLPQLQYLDEIWIHDRADQIFPPAYEANTICALDGLASASFTRPVYELLARNGVIDLALSLKPRARNARGKLLERVAAAYLWGIEHLDGPHLTKIFDTATVADLEVMTRVFWMVRNANLTADQRERILAFWDRGIAWSQHQPEAPARLLSSLSLLATHVATIAPREQRLLETAAPSVHVGHESYEFVGELLRLAPQDPAGITRVLHLMIAAHLPDYDYQDRLRSLLEFLANHGQREAVIVICDHLRHLEGVGSLFKALTQH